jgi:hypothetical protein
MFRYICATVLTLTCLIHGSTARAEVTYDPEARLAELKLTLPPLDPIIGNFVRAVRDRQPSVSHRPWRVQR